MSYPRDYRGTALERFWRKVDKNGPIPAARPDLGPCWIWKGARDANGYGRFPLDTTSGGRSFLAHLFSYCINVGDVAFGFELDHLCRVPACCNPCHLEPVSHKVNCARGNSNGALAVRTGVCYRGHDLAIHGYVRKDRRGRNCQECRRLLRRAAA
jgi:hypothetical protein